MRPAAFDAHCSSGIPAPPLFYHWALARQVLGLGGCLLCLWALAPFRERLCLLDHCVVCRHHASLIHELELALLPTHSGIASQKAVPARVDRLRGVLAEEPRRVPSLRELDEVRLNEVNLERDVPVEVRSTPAILRPRHNMAAQVGFCMCGVKGVKTPRFRGRGLVILPGGTSGATTQPPPHLDCASRYR